MVGSQDRTIHFEVGAGVVVVYLIHFPFKSLNIKYRSLGYHKENNEPGRFLSQEKPVRFQRLVYIALGKGLISTNEAAYYTGVSAWEFRKSMKQLV